MIYFVDEDWVKYDAWLEELDFRGFKVTTCSDADEAFMVLTRAQDVELAVLDVMLSANPDGSERYTRDRTSDFLSTGLELLKDLVVQRPELFPGRAALLTNTVNPETRAAALRIASHYGIELVEKMEILSPFDFGDRVQELLDARRPE